jgi:hypothetical protein
MVYGSEAVLPADLIFGVLRVTFESIAEAEATRMEDIDVLEEEQLNTIIQSARYQQTLRRYRDKDVQILGSQLTSIGLDLKSARLLDLG